MQLEGRHAFLVPNAFKNIYIIYNIIYNIIHCLQ